MKERITKECTPKEEMLTKEEAIARFGADTVNKAITSDDWIDAGPHGNYRLCADYPYLTADGQLDEDRVQFAVEDKPWHMEQKMGGDWQLWRGDEIILDDSACEDFYGDEETVKLIFKHFIAEYYDDDSDEYYNDDSDE